MSIEVLNCPISSFVWGEMIFRCTKNFLRRKLRSLHSLYSNENQVKASLTKYINLLFGNSEAARFYWSSVIKVQLEAKFGEYGPLGEKGKPVAGDIRQTVKSIQSVFFRTLSACGLSLSSYAWLYPFRLNSQALFHTPTPFTEQDINSTLAPRVKTVVDLGLHGVNVEQAGSFRLPSSFSSLTSSFYFASVAGNLQGLASVEPHLRRPMLNRLGQTKELGGARQAFFASQSVRFSV